MNIFYCNYKLESMFTISVYILRVLERNPYVWYFNVDSKDLYTVIGFCSVLVFFVVIVELLIFHYLHLIWILKLSDLIKKKRLNIRFN